MPTITWLCPRCGVKNSVELAKYDPYKAYCANCGISKRVRREIRESKEVVQCKLKDFFKE